MCCRFLPWERQIANRNEKKCIKKENEKKRDKKINKKYHTYTI